MRPEITVDRERLVETAGRMIDVHSFTGDEQGMAELMVELYRAARSPASSGSRSRTAAPTRSAPGPARAAARR